jgi:hypothetical protein
MFAGNSHPSAMDLILAINRNTPVKRTLHKKNAIDGEMAKRMNITKFSNGTMVITNTTEVLNGTDMMLQENIGRKSALAHSKFLSVHPTPKLV